MNCIRQLLLRFRAGDGTACCRHFLCTIGHLDLASCSLLNWWTARRQDCFMNPAHHRTILQLRRLNLYTTHKWGRQERQGRFLRCSACAGSEEWTYASWGMRTHLSTGSYWKRRRFVNMHTMNRCLLSERFWCVSFIWTFACQQIHQLDSACHSSAEVGHHHVSHLRKSGTDRRWTPMLFAALLARPKSAQKHKRKSTCLTKVVVINFRVLVPEIYDCRSDLGMAAFTSKHQTKVSSHTAVACEILPSILGPEHSIVQFCVCVGVPDLNYRLDHSTDPGSRDWISPSFHIVLLEVLFMSTPVPRTAFSSVYPAPSQIQ